MWMRERVICYCFAKNERIEPDWFQSFMFIRWWLFIDWYVLEKKNKERLSKKKKCLHRVKVYFAKRVWTMMKSSALTSSNREALIQRWQRQLHGRTHITFQELMYLLRQRVWETNILSLYLVFHFNVNSFFQQLLETLFHLFDRDSSGLLSESEWIGSIYKVTEYLHRFVLEKNLPLKLFFF